MHNLFIIMQYLCYLCNFMQGLCSLYAILWRSYTIYAVFHCPRRAARGTESPSRKYRLCPQRPSCGQRAALKICGRNQSNGETLLILREAVDTGPKANYIYICQLTELYGPFRDEPELWRCELAVEQAAVKLFETGLSVSVVSEPLHNHRVTKPNSNAACGTC